MIDSKDCILCQGVHRVEFLLQRLALFLCFKELQPQVSGAWLGAITFPTAFAVGASVSGVSRRRSGLNESVQPQAIKPKVSGRIYITVVMASAMRTSPFTVGKFQIFLLEATAFRANLARRIELRSLN